MRNASLSTMVVGVVLAIGMGGLLLAWLALDTGSGFVGLLFVVGILVGLAIALSGAFSDRRPD